MSNIDSFQPDIKDLHHHCHQILTRSFVRWLMAMLAIVFLTGCASLQPMGGTADSGLGDVRELPEITPFGMP
jgi:hypothetical protein